MVTALALCRFAQDTAAMLLWGAFAYLWALVPHDLASMLERHGRRWGIGTAMILAAATAAALPIEAAMIGDGWNDAFNPDVVRSVLVATSVGEAWLAQALAASVIVVVALTASRARSAAMAGASCLFLVSLAFTGHATLQEGWLGLLHRCNDTLHVLSGGAWFGALVPVAVILGRLGRETWRHDGLLALRRFSLAGHGAVILVLVSGIANTALILGRWPVEWALPYQALLVAKIMVVIAMVALASINRYILVPSLAKRDGFALAALRLGTLAEIPLGLVAIGLVAVFGLLDPG